MVVTRLNPHRIAVSASTQMDLRRSVTTNPNPNPEDIQLNSNEKNIGQLSVPTPTELDEIAQAQERRQTHSISQAVGNNEEIAAGTIQVSVEGILLSPKINLDRT